MPRKPTIALAGAGRLAGVLGPALRRAGYRILEVVARDRAASHRRARSLARRLAARASTPATADLRADLVWLCVADDAIAACARALRPRAVWEGKTVLHSSGALPSSALEPLRRAGARVASLHPMMTFAAGASPSLAGVPFAVEGDPAAVRLASRIARDLGGKAFPIRSAAKPLYHAAGSFASPLVVATLALAERLATRSGIPRHDAPRVLRALVEQTLDNYFRSGAAVAFTGPIARGDVATVRRHLAVLKPAPAVRDAYVALARAALETLPAQRRATLRRLLK